MRILHVTMARTWRGGERQLVLLAAKQQEMGADVRVLCPCASAVAEALHRRGIRTSVLPGGGDLNLRGARKLRRVFHEAAPDLVHTHCAHAHAVALLAGIHQHLPIVVHRRVDFPLRRSLGSFAKYRLFPVHYIAVSQAVAEVLRQGGIAETRISTIYSAIEMPPRLDSLARRKLASDLDLDLNFSDFWLGCVGSLVEHKGHQDLFDAFRLAVQHRQNIKLLIIGDGPLLDKLKSLARRFEIDSKVRFLGFHPRPTDVMQLLDLYVVPSRQEGLNTSLLDACALGLPIVASVAGGVGEIVDSNVGWPVPPRNPGAMARAIVEVSAAKEERKARGYAAQVLVKSRFRVEQMAQETDVCYRRVLADF